MLLLQDDAFPADLWDVGIEKFMVKDLRGRPPWTLLSFYYPQSFNDWDPYHHAERYLVPCCAQALLFNASELPGLMAHMEARVRERPMDLNIHKYMREAGKMGYVHVPSLFQHEGMVRTAAHRAEFHFDAQFDEGGVRDPYGEEEEGEGGNGRGRGGGSEGRKGDVGARAV